MRSSRCRHPNWASRVLCGGRTVRLTGIGPMTVMSDWCRERRLRCQPAGPLASCPIASAVRSRGGWSRSRLSPLRSSGHGTVRPCLPVLPSAGTRSPESSARGFGTTYLARHSSLHHDVALKEYLPTAFALRPDGVTVVPSSTEVAEDSLGVAEDSWMRAAFSPACGMCRESCGCSTSSKRMALPISSWNWWSASPSSGRSRNRGGCLRGRSTRFSRRCSTGWPRCTVPASCIATSSLPTSCSMARATLPSSISAHRAQPSPAAIPR